MSDTETFTPLDEIEAGAAPDPEPEVAPEKKGDPDEDAPASKPKPRTKPKPKRSTKAKASRGEPPAAVKGRHLETELEDIAVELERRRDSVDQDPEDTNQAIFHIREAIAGLARREQSRANRGVLGTGHR